MTPQDVLKVINDPVSQRLILSVIPARLAYNGLDGFPRVIPVGYHWDGSHFVVGSPWEAPKVNALLARPQVALTVDTEGMPPNILLVRGIASVRQVDGVAPEFLEASRRRVPAEGWEGFEQEVHRSYTSMAVITIQPHWAKVIDFVTRFPGPVAQAADEADG